MRAQAFIGMGSNRGDRLGFLQKALQTIDTSKHVRIVNVSSIYETQPVGLTNQPLFLNMVIEIETNFSADELLTYLLKLEKKYGRKRGKLWGPRTLDLDILLYNQENIKSERLQIPHPRMQERGFVLIPLYELDPQLNIPPFGKTVAEMLTELTDKEGVKLWRRKTGAGEFGLFEN